MADDSQSKAKKVLETFNSHPYEVLDARSLRQLFEEQHKENISLKATSCIVRRLWKKSVILRTPTQAKSGYLLKF